jgi:hypothetical protein
LLSGCKGTDKENIGAALGYGPLIAPGLPVYFAVKEWKASGDDQKARYYVPAGLTKEQVVVRADEVLGRGWRKQVSREGEFECWRLSTRRGICIARFKDGISVRSAP